MKNLFLKGFILFLFACGIIILMTPKKETKITSVEIENVTDSEFGNVTGMRYSDTQINGSK